MKGLTVGRIVNYVMDDGQVRPAVIVNVVFEDGQDETVGTCDLGVFITREDAYHSGNGIPAFPEPPAVIGREAVKFSLTPSAGEWGWPQHTTVTMQNPEAPLTDMRFDESDGK